VIVCYHGYIPKRVKYNAVNTDGRVEVEPHKFSASILDGNEVVSFICRPFKTSASLGYKIGCNPEQVWVR
jgi:hypothetical protein